MSGKMRSPGRPRARLAALALAVLGLLTVGCQTPASRRDPAALARGYLEAGRLAEATREIELAVRSSPQDVELRLLAASILAQSGDLARAVGHLDVALRVAPGNPEISIRLGELERQRDNLPDAYVAFRRASELAPDEIRAVSGLALAAEALGFREEADRAYARWAELEERQGARP